MAHKTGLIVPIAIVLIGIGWLLNTLNIIRDINWIWILALASVGIIVFVVDGFNRFSIVIGPFFLAAACMSLARQMGHINSNIEVPILVILFGILLLIAQVSKLPAPRWMLEPPRQS